MHAWEAIQVTVDYIENHIDQNLTIEELSKMANLSQFYYQRLFARLVKKPVKEYIKLRRLARACESLRNQKRVIDVALDYGFKNHETFTRAFKATYNMTPNFYRTCDVELDNFDKPDLFLMYSMVDEKTPIISEGMVIEYRFMTLDHDITFYGANGYYPFQSGKMLGERPGVSGVQQIWKDFSKLRSKIQYQDDAKIIGVSYPGDASVGYSSYFVGVESTLVQPEFALWTLPKRDYVVCHFEVNDTKHLDGSVVGRAMKHTRYWLREHGLRADGFFPEVYNFGNSVISSMELWIPFKSRNEEV